MEPNIENNTKEKIPLIQLGGHLYNLSIRVNEPKMKFEAFIATKENSTIPTRDIHWKTIEDLCIPAGKERINKNIKIVDSNGGELKDQDNDNRNSYKIFFTIPTHDFFTIQFTTLFSKINTTSIIEFPFIVDKQKWLLWPFNNKERPSDGIHAFMNNITIDKIKKIFRTSIRHDAELLDHDHDGKKQKKNTFYDITDYDMYFKYVIDNYDALIYVIKGKKKYKEEVQNLTSTSYVKTGMDSYTFKQIDKILKVTQTTTNYEPRTTTDHTTTTIIQIPTVPNDFVEDMIYLFYNDKTSQNLTSSHHPQHSHFDLLTSLFSMKNANSYLKSMLFCHFMIFIIWNIICIDSVSSLRLEFINKYNDVCYNSFNAIFNGKWSFFTNEVDGTSHKNRMRARLHLLNIYLFIISYLNCKKVLGFLYAINEERLDLYKENFKEKFTRSSTDSTTIKLGTKTYDIPKDIW